MALRQIREAVCNIRRKEGSWCVSQQASRVDDALDSKCESSQKSLTPCFKHMSKNSDIWKQYIHRRCENMVVKGKINTYGNQFLSAEVYI
jgi:hypothetical protein